jgi:hypothetical protein
MSEPLTSNQIVDLMVENGIDLKNVLDAVIASNGIIGVGLITLGEDLQAYCFNKIKAPG